MKAIIRYNPNTQKKGGGKFRDVVPQSVLKDICFRITGQSNFIVIEEIDSYNKGRLVILEFEGQVNYITVSAKDARGRNSSLQSVATALNMFYSSKEKK